MQNILVGLFVLLLAAGLLAAALRPGRTPRHFIDADQDGEPDESPEEKRRAMKEDLD